MRTTIRLPDEIHRRAKELALTRGWTLTKLIKETLTFEIYKPPAPTNKPYRIRVHKGGAINPAFVGKSFGEIEAMLDEIDPPFAVREYRKQQAKKKRARS